MGARMKISLEIKEVSEKNTALKWLRNRQSKNENIFLNKEIGEAELEELFSFKKRGVKKRIEFSNDEISPADTQRFINKCLSESALKKLRTTMRVAASRLGTTTLQVKVDATNKDKLDYLALKTGMKKTDIINKLIELADLKKITITEEQLEITL